MNALESDEISFKESVYCCFQLFKIDLEREIRKKSMGKLQ